MNKKLNLILFINLGLYASGLAMFIVAPEFSNFIFSILGFSFFITLCLLAWKRKSLITLIKRKSFQLAFNNLLNIFLMMCILGVINYLIYKNDYYIDLTQNKLHSLSNQSKDAIKLLANHDLKLNLYAKRGTWAKYISLLKLYESSSKNIKLEMFDVDKEVTLVSINNVTENGTLVVEYLGKTYKTIAKNELAVTNLLLKILSPNKKRLYYSVGHNEMSLNDKNAVGGNFLKEKILNSNYELYPLELQKGVPADASGVLVLNPQIEFLKIEIDNLRTYLKKGGSLLTTLSPHFNGVMVKNYLDLLIEYGINFKNILILDRLAAQQGSQASIPVVNSYPIHKITKGMTDRTLFPVSGSLEMNDNTNIKWSALAKSTPFPGSWGEVSFEEVKQGRAAYNEGIDFQGPLNIVAAGEGPKTRILVFSSANFVANQFQGQSNNFNFFINSISWLVREEALMSLNRPQLEGNLIYISDTHLTLIFYFAIVFCPFFFFALGIFMFRKKLSR
jgi:ABC-type uncharacterized transport system involved in gliding motility auxiliary subunit